MGNTTPAAGTVMQRRLDESGCGHTDRGHAQHAERVLHVLRDL